MDLKGGMGIDALESIDQGDIGIDALEATGSEQTLDDADRAAPTSVQQNNQFFRPSAMGEDFPFQMIGIYGDRGIS